MKLSNKLKRKCFEIPLLGIAKPLAVIGYGIQTSFTELYKHRLHFLSCNLNQNSDCYALERINDYGTKN
jgi:hypothetical protein